MWLLTQLHTGNKLYIIPEVYKYTVGRAGSNIVLKDDSSISRSHAILTYFDASLKLEDTGSKYGTYHNENIANRVRVSKDSPIEIKEGDHILFGVLKNEWIASKLNISAMTSALSASQAKECQGYLKSLGGKLISKWEPSCTHLTMSEITITIKVLQALIEKIPIVSCEFWKDYLENVKDQRPPPNVGKYLPKPSALLSAAISSENFIFNDKRKVLFAGKTFVFMSKKHCDLYSQIIEKAGGECRDLKSNTPKSFLIQKNVIIVQYIPSTQSQSSQTVNNISEYLQTHSVRTIPEYEIGLAIVCCTIDKYCNPAYNPMSHVLPCSPLKTPNIGSILVENTRSQKSEMNSLGPMIVEIAETEYPHSSAAQSNGFQSEIYEKEVSEIKPAADESKIATTNKMLTSKDGMSSSSIVSNNNENLCKKRKKSNMWEESTTKKAHIILQEDDENNIIEELSSSLPTKSVSISGSNGIDPTSSRQTKTGFLEKSQTDSLDKKKSQNRRQVPKRGRIACITGNESDGEDIFNFGSPAKNFKGTNSGSDDELFDFGEKGTKVVDAEIETSENVLLETQPFIVDKNKIRALSKIKVEPIKPSLERWLSKWDAQKIKSDLNTSVNIVQVKEENDDPCKNEWIESIKGCFEVRIRKMNLTTKEKNASTLIGSSTGPLNTSKKNFKAFVKKNNYKPQTLVIQTNRR